MTELWKAFEGQIIHSTFPLQQYLGGAQNSAVFLTQLAAPESAKAVVKLIPAGPAAELQLSLWRRASQLNHPNLLRLLHSGRCRLANKDLLFAVMEFAEEDLSQILPQRPLTPAEAHDMVEPVLDALVYLHSRGLVHSRIKPSNILATGDQVKLSSDTLFPLGESPKSRRATDIYDAPESAASPLSPAADVWSLGITLVEALTQRAPALPSDRQSDPLVPEMLPQPFLEIARHALVRDPKRRWTTADIAARLNPAAAAAAAAQASSPSAQASSTPAVSPLTVPLSTVPAIPAAKLPSPKSESPVRRDTPPPRPQAAPPRPQSVSPRPRQTFVLPNYVVPLFAAIFIIVAIIALPKILSRRPEPPSTVSPTSVSVPPAAQTPPKTTGQKPAATKNLAEDALRSSAPPASKPAPAPAPASLRTETFPSANGPSSSAASPARGEVLDQVLPDISEKARATIQGAVRVTVRVQVDPSGTVSDASLDSPGPSKYFADLALKAARRWQFTSPERNGHSVPSTWLIQFQFSQSATKAFPRQTAP